MMLNLLHAGQLSAFPARTIPDESISRFFVQLARQMKHNPDGILSLA